MASEGDSGAELVSGGGDPDSVLELRLGVEKPVKGSGEGDPA